MDQSILKSGHRVEQVPVTDSVFWLVLVLEVVHSLVELFGHFSKFLQHQRIGL